MPETQPDKIDNQKNGTNRGGNRGLLVKEIQSQASGQGRIFQGPQQDQADGEVMPQARQPANSVNDLSQPEGADQGNGDGCQER